jgi:signal transduction histidine kinase/CheY-like chemotaxis protein
MRSGRGREGTKGLPWAALLLLGGVTLLAGAAAQWLAPGGVVPVLAASAAAVLSAAGFLAERSRRATVRTVEAIASADVARLRGELDRVKGELDGERRALEEVRRHLDAAVAGRRDREERVLQSERLASVGTLAGGVAHEVNNPLAYVAANLDFVDQQVEALLAGELPFTASTGEEMRSAIADARAGILRVRDVVRGMRSFARASRDRKRPGHPRLELETALSLAANEIRHRARLTVHIEDMPPVEDAEHELTQVFVNLLVNAAQSIPDGRAKENEVRVDARYDAAGDCVRVEIADTGCGIAPEALPRIFDPFYTTRPVGFGAGLGLSICHGIVRSLGGEIQVESQPGRGSTFRVVVPVARRAAPPAGALAAPVAAPRRRVLVVDDDATIGRSLRRLLEPQHAVAYASSARDALDRLERGERFDVLLCDLMMPDMSGMAFEAEVARRWPDAAAAIAFMTGGAFTDRAREFLDRTNRPVVEKPIDPGALRALIAALPAERSRNIGG